MLGGALFKAGFKLKMLPNKVCWITGNLDKTSALYIFVSPKFTLSQDETALTFQSLNKINFKENEIRFKVCVW